MNHDLPIFQIQSQLLSILQNGNCCIVHAPTGSGKSTMVPQFLSDNPCLSRPVVLVLQPRRMAARLLAEHVSKLRHTDLGEEVGYQIRFESVKSARTRILFVTEGILLMRLLSGDILNEVGAILFDEFHERHLESDLSLALCRQLQMNIRKDLKMVVMSATLEVEDLRQYLLGCPVLEVKVRSFPVKIVYKSPGLNDKIWDFAAEQVDAIVSQGNPGSVLIFMPGSYEINRCLEACRNRKGLSQYIVLPLHGSLSRMEQIMALQEGSSRIIVSTNVAETSLTIPDISIVVDSGMAKVARFDSKRGVNQLFIEPISQSAANQRAGRAGRTSPGICIRLWSEFSHEMRAGNQTPEVHRVDISEVLLGLKGAEYSSLMAFPWLEKPSENQICAAIELLKLLEAVDEEEGITSLGRRMAELHVHPRFARILLMAFEKNCVYAGSLAVAIAQVDGIFLSTQDEVILQERKHAFGNPLSDLLFEVNALLWAKYNQFDLKKCKFLGININLAKQAYQLAIQLSGKMKFSVKSPQIENKTALSNEETIHLRECIFHSFADYLAVRPKKGSLVCQMMHGKSGRLHPNSIVQTSKFMVATCMEEVRQGAGVLLVFRMASEVDESWLSHISYEGAETSEWNCYLEERKMVVKVKMFKINGMLLNRIEEPILDDEIAAGLITDAILEGKVIFPQWNSEVEHYIRRVNFASRHAPQYNISEVDNQAKNYLIQQTVYKCRSEKDIQKVSLWKVLHSWLNPFQQTALDIVAPSSISLPKKNRQVKLRYDENGDVVLSETIQAFYDIEPVYVAEGKVQVKYELLSPARRPVQITSDLNYFWNNSYLEIKKQLKGRYPKHEWR